MDSQIRLRQLNQQDISGYITKVIPVALAASGLVLSGGALLPSSSGTYDLGTAAFAFDDIYLNKLHVPSGSGIFFGNTMFTAYYSGSDAVLQFGNYYITTSPVGLSIIGPSGSQGLTGPSGLSGASGIGITGIFKSGGFMNIYTTDGKITNVALASGATGATGVSVTGFYTSGVNWILPQYSNNTTGTPIFIPSGMQGAQGAVGGINYICDKLTGISGSQGINPQATFYYVDPYSSINPKLNFIKGMRYTVIQSGIKASPGYNGSGQNIYVNEVGSTGYLRFCFWDISLDPNLCGSTGRWNQYECANVGYAATDITNYVGDNIGAWTNIVEDNYEASVSFNIAWNAQTGYRYGFIRCLPGGQFDTTTEMGVACGVAAVSLFGPQGPSGSQGPQGVPGPQGQRGPAGQSSPGVGIDYVEQGTYQIRFHYTDGTMSDWIALPAGGAQGPQGPTGPVGPSGVAGPIGPVGPSGDKYAGAFYVNNVWSTVGSGTFQGIQRKAGGVGAWQLLQGAGMTFYTGDMIWFTSQSLVGMSYVPWQHVLLSSPSYANPYNFYADIVYYNSNNGEIQLAVSPVPSMPTYNPINFNNAYNGAFLINLGGLGSPGPSGSIGPSGVQGLPGIAGQNGSVKFSCSPLTPMQYTVATNLDVSTYDFWDLSMSGGYNLLTFNMSKWDVGKSVMVRIRNTGCYSSSDGPDVLLTWQGGIRFPYNDTNAPGPDPNGTCIGYIYPSNPGYCNANVYSLLRLPDSGGGPTPYDILCTYSFNYVLPCPMYS